MKRDGPTAAAAGMVRLPDRPGRLASEYVSACRRKVHEVMSPEVFTASEDTPVDRIVQIMEERRIKRLPILRGGKLVGIISRTNLVRAIAHMTGTDVNLAPSQSGQSLR